MRESDVHYLEKYLSSDKLEWGMKQLEKGISPQYIVGNVDFCGNIMKVNENVLIPRFETELLVEKTCVYIKKYFEDVDCCDLSILDMGTGSGCIGITLAKELGSHVTLVDISREALDVALENALLNQVEVTICSSDVFSGVDGQFDCLISNPPYIRENEEIEEIVLKNEPSIALFAGGDGLFFYDKILRECSNYLKDRFVIAFEIGYLQGDAVIDLAYQYLSDIDVKVEKDYSGRDRFVFIFSKNYG